MKRNMDCIGFSPPREMLVFMSEVLSEIQHRSPSDSYVDAFVTRRNNGFNVNISIKFHDGEFSTDTTDTQLDKAIRLGSKDLFTQLKQWHESRF